MAIYIDQVQKDPPFHWNQSKLAYLLARVRHRQGRLLGRMEMLGENLGAEAAIGGPELSKIYQYIGPLSYERLCHWNTELCEGDQGVVSGLKADRGLTGGEKGKVADIEEASGRALGSMGKPAVHFETATAHLPARQMQAFLRWLNTEKGTDPVIKAAVAQCWLLAIGPFGAGNGPVALAVAEWQLARTEGGGHRFYSLSAQVRKEEDGYSRAVSSVFTHSRKTDPDITGWLEWFLHCFDKAIAATDGTIDLAMKKGRFWKKHAGDSFNSRQKKMLQALLSGFADKLTSSSWAKMVECSSDSAVRDINDLVERGILVKDMAGGRSTCYEFYSL